ncbi:hypothetical protein GCM10027085_24510 [Spirosoma aerophilum]
MNTLRWINTLPGGIDNLRFGLVRVIARVSLAAYIEKGALLGNGIFEKLIEPVWYSIQ